LERIEMLQTASLRKVVSLENLPPAFDSISQELGARKIQKNYRKCDWLLHYFK